VLSESVRAIFNFVLRNEAGAGPLGKRLPSFEQGSPMYHHVKKLMFTVRVDEPDVRFGNMLLEQFGGANGELAADAGLDPRTQL
jgi:hypothetical protein